MNNFPLAEMDYLSLELIKQHGFEDSLIGIALPQGFSLLPIRCARTKKTHSFTLKMMWRGMKGSGVFPMLPHSSDEPQKTNDNGWKELFK